MLADFVILLTTIGDSGFKQVALLKGSHSVAPVRTRGLVKACMQLPKNDIIDG